MSDLSLDVNFEGSVIEVDAEFGYSNTRYVSPSEYTGELTVVPSHERHILETTGKMLNGNVTVEAAPTSEVIFTENGEYLPPEGEVGFRKVEVSVAPDLRPLSVSENGQYSPDGFDGYSGVSVNTPVPSGSINITDNGTYDVSYKSSVNVAVEGQWIDYDDVPVTLPEEYQRVEYIESSGTQFIELPIGFYPTDTISFKGANNQYEIDDKYLVASQRWNNDNNRFALLGSNRNLLSNRVICFGYGSKPTGATWYYEQVVRDSNFHTIDYSNKVSLIDRGLGAIGVGNIAFGSETTNLKLFYGYNSNTAGKICYYIHEKADGRKLALYACYRKSDGVIGMYDIENDVFYTNDGTGDFTKGQDI